MAEIEIRNIYKIFGNSLDKAMAMAREGRSKADILSETGASVGLRDVSLETVSYTHLTLPTSDLV